MWKNIRLFLEKKKLNALCANPGANHAQASLRAGRRVNVSSIVHYNSTPEE